MNEENKKQKDTQENITSKLKETTDNLKQKTSQFFDKFKKKEVDEHEAFEKEIKDVKKKEEITEKPAEENTDKRPVGDKKTFVLAIIVSVIVFLGICGCVGALVFANKLLEGKPEFNQKDIVSPDSTVIYDADGNKLIELGLYLRENISYDQMPNSLIDAFLAIEDSRYFEHFGFDIPRFTMAALVNLRTRDFSQGGSTITMQLIKNSYFQVDAGSNSTIADRNGMSGIQRKMQEIVLAIEADHTMDKREILAAFINKINFGNNIRGVQKAAEYYFGKEANELNLSECAFLAGIINSPNSYNPYNNLYKNSGNMYINDNLDYLANATQRRNEVLNLMLQHGYITKTECDLAKSIRIEDQLSGIHSSFNETNEYYQSYIDAIIDEAIEVTGKNPYTYPMEIHSNMDPRMQQLVYDIQNENTAIKYSNDLCQNAIVILNNQTGELIALGGGRNQSGARSFNRATSAYIQPGSSIKTVLEYPLAFEVLGWATTHTITDRPYYLYGGNILVANAGGQGYTGDMLLTEAVARSLNTPAVQALEAVIREKDEQFVVDYMNSIGFQVDKEDFDLQFAIGGNRMVATPVQMAGAHAVMINKGMYVKPHTIKYIKLYNEDDYVADTVGTRVLSEATAYLTAVLEQNNVSGEFFNYMQILKRSYPVFGKTGTTDWANSGVSYGIPVGSIKDEWLVCSTSNYTIANWLGFDKLEKGAYFTAYEDSLNIKGKICKLILDELEDIEGYEPTALERPDSVVSITHVKGAYPYAYGDGFETVTGLISKEYYDEHPLVNAYSLLENLPVKNVDGYVGSISGYVEYGSAYLNFSNGGYATGSGGVVDISETNIYGKTTHASGRSYFPHYSYVYSDPGVIYCELKCNGEYITTIESYDGYGYAWGMPEEGTIEACAWTESSSDKACTKLERR